MIGRTGIIDNYDRIKKRVTLIWDDTKNRSLPLLMLDRRAENTTVTDYAAGRTQTPLDVSEGTGILVRAGDPSVPIIGRRALAVMLDGSGHGVYIGMIEE